MPAAGVHAVLLSQRGVGEGDSLDCQIFVSNLLLSGLLPLVMSGGELLLVADDDWGDCVARMVGGPAALCGLDGGG